MTERKTSARPASSFAAADAFLRRRTSTDVFWASVVLILLLAVAVLCIALWPRMGRYTVSADTDVVTVEIPGGSHLPVWGDLPLEAGDAQAGGRCAGATLRLADHLDHPLKAVIRRSGEGLQVDLQSDAASLGALTCKGLTTPAGSHATLRWSPPERPDGQPDKAWIPPVLAFEGYVEIGSQGFDEVVAIPVLKTGSVTVEAASRSFRSGRPRTEAPLSLGDNVSFQGEAGKPVIARGVATLSEDALDVVVRADAKHASIIRFGESDAEPTLVAPSLLSRLQAQDEWAIYAILGTLAVGLFGALKAYVAALETRKAQPGRKRA